MPWLGHSAAAEMENGGRGAVAPPAVRRIGLRQALDSRVFRVVDRERAHQDTQRADVGPGRVGLDGVRRQGAPP